MWSLRNTDTRRQTKKTFLNTEEKLALSEVGWVRGRVKG